MDSNRNLLRNDHSSLSTKISSSSRDERSANQSQISASTSQLRSSIVVTKNKIENDMPSEDEDCFLRFGFIPLSEEEEKRNSKENASNKPIDEEGYDSKLSVELVEEINAIIAVVIYQTFAEKHDTRFRRRINQTPVPSRSNPIDRFDGLYSCVNKQLKYQKNYLRNRFFTLPNMTVSEKHEHSPS